MYILLPTTNATLLLHALLRILLYALLSETAVVSGPPAVAMASLLPR